MHNYMQKISSENFSSKQLHSILDNTVDGILVINQTGTILSFNKACCDLFGYAPEEVIGKNISLLMPDYIGSQHNRYLEKYLETKVQNVIGVGRETVGKKRDGTEFAAWISVGEVSEADELFFVGILRDI